MSDMWAIASADVQAEHDDRAFFEARQVCTRVWPYLAAAVDDADFENRLALCAERIDDACDRVASARPIERTALRLRVDASLRDDFALIHEARTAAKGCPYCGDVENHLGSARTANGKDVERFERIHRNEDGWRPGGPVKTSAASWHFCGEERDGKVCNRVVRAGQSGHSGEHNFVDPITEKKSSRGGSPSAKTAGNPHAVGSPAWFDWEAGEGDPASYGPSSGVPRDLFPGGGVPLHGDLTPEQAAWLRKRDTTAVRHTAPGGGEHGGYHIESDGGKWKVVNHIGEVKSTFDSHDEALKYQRSLMVNVPGAQQSAEEHEKEGDEPKHSSRRTAADMAHGLSGAPYEGRTSATDTDLEAAHQRARMYGAGYGHGELEREQKQSSRREANQYVQKRGDDWVILQKDTGKVLSHHDSEEKANEAFRAMEMSKHSGSLRTQADLVGDIMSYEDGSMPEEEIGPFFQGLIDSGMVWKLQGSYGRTAQSLIEAGICHPAGTQASRGPFGTRPPAEWSLDELNAAVASLRPKTSQWHKDGPAYPGGSSMDDCVASWETRYRNGDQILDVEYCVMELHGQFEGQYGITEIDTTYTGGDEDETDVSYHDQPKVYATREEAERDAQSYANEDETWKLGSRHTAADASDYAEHHSYDNDFDPSYRVGEKMFMSKAEADAYAAKNGGKVEALGSRKTAAVPDQVTGVSPQILALMDGGDWGADPWGETMGWLFAIGDVLTEWGPPYPPATWQFRQGLGGSDTDSYHYQELTAALEAHEITPEDVLAAGNALNEYSHQLEAQGRSY